MADTPVPVMNPAQLAALAKVREDCEWIAGPLPGGYFLGDNEMVGGDAVLIGPTGEVTKVTWWDPVDLYDAAALAAVEKPPEGT